MHESRLGYEYTNQCHITQRREKQTKVEFKFDLNEMALDHCLLSLQVGTEWN